MTSLSSIKTIFSGNGHPEESSLVESDEKSASSLTSALQAVDEMMSNSDVLKAAATYQVSAKLESSEDPKTTQIEPDAMEAPVDPGAKLKAPDQNTESERALCLRRKQQTLSEMTSHIRKSSELLSAVAKQSDQLAAYFTKSEVDLSHFELIEARSARAQQLIVAISARHKEMKLALVGQREQIDLLQALKNKNRDTIERALGEINRLNADVTNLQSDNKQQNFDIGKLTDDKNALIEKVDQLTALDSENKALLAETRQNLAAFQLQAKEQERLIAGQTGMIHSLTEERDSGLVEIKDLQTAQKNLLKKLTDAQVRIDEINHGSEIATKDFEQKLRHRDSRVLKLETENEVLNRQLIKTEERLADLSHQIRQKKVLRVVSQQPDRGNGSLAGQGKNLGEISRQAVAASLN